MSTLIYYEIVDNNIEEPCPYDLLADHHSSIRIRDFRPNRAVERCDPYKISMSSCNLVKLKKSMNHLKKCRVNVLRVVLNGNNPWSFSTLHYDNAEFKFYMNHNP